MEITVSEKVPFTLPLSQAQHISYKKDFSYHTSNVNNPSTQIHYIQYTNTYLLFSFITTTQQIRCFSLPKSNTV